MIAEKIADLIRKSLSKLGFESADFVVEHPEIISHGDYSTNVALVLAKRENKNPKELAQIIRGELEGTKEEFIESIEVAGHGFINFKLSSIFFQKALEEILSLTDSYGKNKNLEHQKTIIEYTDPNPFKEFHIGHLMSNTIGESISRIFEWNGAEVRRACYQGDVGLHVASAVAHKLWYKTEWKNEKDVAFSYAEGAGMREKDQKFRNFTVEVNKKIYDKTDDEVNAAYELGRKLTLDYFEKIYSILGTKFDFYFFESTTGEFGKALVHENTPRVFEESEGAIVYKGESRNNSLHTRVFINKEGLPTYEAKELGLAKIKFDTYPYERSLVITGNEIKDYFRVLLSAMSEIFPELAKSTVHIPHGMLRLPSGKMSSRTGDVITAENLIAEVKNKIGEKIDASDRVIADKDALAEAVAVGAIKYSILRQSTGKDIIFDFEKSISFEGDSGPYLQYTYARIHSILEKAKAEGIGAKTESQSAIYDIERILYRFPEIVDKAMREHAPNHILTFALKIAGEFNSFYAENQIVVRDDNRSSLKVAIAKATGIIIKNSLILLGISAPERM